MKVSAGKREIGPSRTGWRRRLWLRVCAVGLAAGLVLTAIAQGADGTFDRAWGKDVGGAGIGICTVAASCQPGVAGALAGEFSAATWVAIGPAGNFYVAEASNRRIQKFDSAGNFLLAWGKDVGGAGVDICTVAAACQAGAAGGLGGEFSSPEGVATDSSGDVYVADLNDNRIQKFDSGGNFLRAWGKDVGGAHVSICTVAASCQAGAAGGLSYEFSNPRGVATDPAGNVYVADAGNKRIQKFNSSGSFLRTWGKDVGGAGIGICREAAACQAGTGGTRGGEFADVVGVATDAGGNVYSADGGNGRRIDKFDSSGNFLGAWGKDVGGAGVNICTVAANCQLGAQGVRGDEFSSPEGVATDSSGNVYTTDLFNGRVQKFDSSGNFLRAWGKDVGGSGVPICTVAANCQGGAQGGLAGEFNAPEGVATDASGGLYVVDSANERIQKFAAPPAQRTLTVTVSGSGSGTVTGPGIGCTGGAGASNRCSTTVADGAQVTLTAAPDPGSGFTGFAGGGCGATSPCTVTLNADQSVDAKFDTAPTPTPPPKPTGGVPINATLPFVTYSLYRDAFVCNPGTWQNLPAVPAFGYEWLRKGPGSGRQRVTISVVGTSQTYQPTAADAGIPFACRVTARNDVGSTSASSAFAPLNPLAVPTVNPTVDIHVTGIEVTQAVQESSCDRCAGTLPSRDQATTTTPGRADYRGVTLAAGKLTVVRVFATFTQPADQSTLTGATATLQVYDSDGHQLSSLDPNHSPALTRTPDWVSASQRAEPGASFNFLIPWQDTLHRALSFRATITPPVGLERLLTQCSGCKANTFELIDVPFVTTAVVPIHPIPLTVAGAKTSKTETQVFGDAQTVLPDQVQIFPYDTPLAVDNMTNAQAAAAVLDRASANGLTGSDYPIGVFYRGEGKLANGLTLGGGHLLYDKSGPISIVQDDRPLTSVAHEIGHGLGLVHADTGSGPDRTGPHPDGTADCKGNSGGQVGEAWPPDDQGRLQSFGLDRRNWSLSKTGAMPQTFVEGYDQAGRALNSPSSYFDFMSYCPAGGVSESKDWISLRNWNRLIAFHPPAQALPASAERRARVALRTSVQVIAAVDPSGTASIFSVEPGQDGTPASTASPYRIELRDAAGMILTSVTPATTPVHVDGTPGQRPSLLLQATLPFVPSTAAVVVSAGGVELARRARSAQVPTVTLISPRGGSTIGRAATTLMRWAARDADGDRLTASVDYSADGGRHWRVVADRLSGSSARVPSGALSASRHGRIRVRVSDGFDSTSATSGPLAALGAPPSVRIIGVGRRGRVREDAMLLLQAAAFDDSGRLLTGRRLRWYAGRRLLGRGELLTVPGLPVGATAIRLSATDGHGRTSIATLPLTVLPIPPSFLLARAPAHVPPNARRVRITIATTAPAVLTIAGASHPVDRSPRAISIAIRPGHTVLHVRYSLRSRGGVIRGTYLALR